MSKYNVLYYFISLVFPILMLILYFVCDIGAQLLHHTSDSVFQLISNPPRFPVDGSALSDVRIDDTPLENEAFLKVLFWAQIIIITIWVILLIATVIFVLFRFNRQYAVRLAMNITTYISMFLVLIGTFVIFNNVMKLELLGILLILVLNTVALLTIKKRVASD